MLFHFIIVLFVVPNSLCVKRIPCDFSDDACITAAHKILFKKLLAGNPAYNAKGSDPLYQEKIEVFLPHMNMTLNNVFMQGLQSCEVEYLRIRPDQWFLSLICSKLTLESDYEINGDIDSVHIEGKGRCEIIYDNNHIDLNGEYETYTSKDGKEHMKVSLSKANHLNVQGNVVYNFDNLFNGDNEKSREVHTYINKEWKKLHDMIAEPIIYNLFRYFVDNINTYLIVIPKGELFFQQL